LITIKYTLTIHNIKHIVRRCSHIIYMYGHMTYFCHSHLHSMLKLSRIQTDSLSRMEVWMKLMQVIEKRGWQQTDGYVEKDPGKNI